MKGIKCLAILVVAAPLVFGLGCKKKEETKIEPFSPPPVAEKPISINKEEITVKLPDSVAGNWKDIKVEVLDKQTSGKTVIIIPVGGETDIPGSGMKVKAESFLPDLVMDGANITSASNEPKNPAAQIVVTDGGKEIHRGWLFANNPAIHPFEHPKFGLTLVGYDPVGK